MHRLQINAWQINAVCFDNQCFVMNLLYFRVSYLSKIDNPGLIDDNYTSIIDGFCFEIMRIHFLLQLSDS